MKKYCAAMKKSLFVGILLSSFAFGAPSVVNGIAFFVNGNPVTLLELYSLQQRNGMNQALAIDALINERLHEEEIKKYKIVVTELEISDEIQRLAKQNKTTAAQIESYVRNNGGSWEDYQEDLKKQLLKRKLYQIITQENLKMVDENELLNYYNTHKEEFSIPQSIDVTKYFSKEGRELEELVRSGGKTILKGVQSENEVLQTTALNPQIVAAFTQGQIGSFTPIYPIGDEFVVFLIKAKNNPAILPFENVRSVVIQKMMTQKEDYLIYEHFEKLRSNAKVDIIRLN